MVCTQFVGYKDLYCQYWHPKQHRACQESSHFLLVISYNQYQQFYPWRPGDFIPKIAVWEICGKRQTPIYPYIIYVFWKKNMFLYFSLHPNPLTFPNASCWTGQTTVLHHLLIQIKHHFVDTNKASFWWIDPEIPTVIYIQKKCVFFTKSWLFHCAKLVWEVSGWRSATWTLAFSRTAEKLMTGMIGKVGREGRDFHTFEKEEFGLLHII